MQKQTTIQTAVVAEQQYVTPEIEIIDLEISQHILDGSATHNDMGGSPWPTG